MLISPDAEVIKPFDKTVGCGLGCVMSDDNAGNDKPVSSECVYETERVHIVSDTEVSANLVLLNRRS